MKLLQSLVLTATALAGLAGLAMADDKSVCQDKANKEQSGVWNVIRVFCDQVPVPGGQGIYDTNQWMSVGRIFKGAKDSTRATLKARNCPQPLSKFSRDSCYGMFYATCSQGGKKGRAQKRFGPLGCIYASLSDA